MRGTAVLCICTCVCVFTLWPKKSVDLNSFHPRMDSNRWALKWKFIFNSESKWSIKNLYHGNGSWNTTKFDRAFIAHFLFLHFATLEILFNGKYSTIHTYNFTLLHAILSIVQTTCILYYIYMYLITAPRSMTLSLL